jgi:hypothetical protein
MLVWGWGYRRIVDDFHIPECRRAVLEYRRARGIVEAMLPVPSDYVLTCMATDNGTILREDSAEVTTWPHAMYWRRERPEEALLPLVLAGPPSEEEQGVAR